MIEIENVVSATSQVAQTTLRSVLGKADLDALLSEREQLNEHLQQIIDDQTEPWGVKVTTVEIKDVEIPERMQHAMARQAEAERGRRAKIINAEGEFQAAARLNDAADVISRNPVTIQLRYLQTLIEVSSNQSSTIVFPLPIDVLQPLVSSAENRRVTADGPERERLDDALAAARAALAASTQEPDATGVRHASYWRVCLASGDGSQKSSTLVASRRPSCLEIAHISTGSSPSLRCDRVVGGGTRTAAGAITVSTWSPKRIVSVPRVTR